MKAIVWTGYGDPEVLQLQEIPVPIPKDNEVLVKVIATTATAGDCELRRMKTALRYRYLLRAYVGLRRPTRLTILGMELAGVVEAVGKDVTQFKVGDEIFAGTDFAGTGTYAEYVCLPEESKEGVVALKPKNMTFEEATPIPIGGIEALQFVRKGNIQSGAKVLINGAGGTIGGYAVQLAKHFGAHVTAVDSTDKLDMLRSIGADFTIDYRKTDFTKTGETYDFILDIVSKSPFSRSIKSLNENGRYLIPMQGLSKKIRGRWALRGSSKKILGGVVKPKTEDLLFLKELAEAGQIRSVIGKRFPLEQTADAHAFVESGNKVGHVVITVEKKKV
ncbi:MAG: NAD(P)-dependent alcohol dehydrogenase [Candidatus Thorarchaeota archaeon]